MALSKTDKNTTIMKEDYGTVCLISQSGEADRLLALAHRRKVNKARIERQPLDAWDI